MLYGLAYLALGAVVGLFAGLLGIGGGVIIIVGLLEIFKHLHFGQAHIMHMALGTSMACILFGSLSSLLAHRSLGSVDWFIVRRLTPGILTGGFLATFAVAQVSSVVLKVCFVIFMVYTATQMLFNAKPKPHRNLPGRVGMLVAGNVIGAISSLVGVGGAAIAIPFMTWCNVQMHRAIGTAAALGFPVSLFGSLGYIVNGWDATGRPDWSLGFVYLPACFGIAVTSTLTAPFGARLSQRLPVPTLKQIFACLLFVLATKLVSSLF
ncbi:MAG: sulfite exporter TauE/SafE family protein [Burkholderiales bacterium]